MNVTSPHTADKTTARRHGPLILLGLAGLSLIVGLVAIEAARTAPVRNAVRAYTILIAAANRGDLDAARAVCTPRYLAAQPLAQAAEGGLIGLPRGIHKNFRAWSVGPDDVHLCPTNPRDRLRPVYRLVHQADAWKFDGLAGQLGEGGVFTQVELPLQP